MATIKPSNPDKPGSGISVNRSGTITTLNTTLFNLVKFAYDLHPKQVIGAPVWIDADKFDITAKPDSVTASSVVDGVHLDQDQHRTLGLRWRRL